MKKYALLFCLLVFSAFLSDRPSLAQDTAVLHVVKSTVNAEAENAEICLEFDKALSPAAPARLVAALRLETDGKPVTPANAAAAGTSLCLFPLERGKSYRLDLAEQRGADKDREIISAPYKAFFTIPDRSPTLAFTDDNGGVNAFGSYDKPLTLRAVNVARAKIELYSLTDPSLRARVWQDRAQTALAPSESAYLARTKGQKIWHEEKTFDAPSNATLEQKIVLRDKIPDLAPGLYLIVADAGKDDDTPANKGLAPLAAEWFTKSDFSLRAVRDDKGIHVFAARTDAPAVKTDVHLAAMSKKPESLAEAQVGADGVGLIAYPPKLADKNDIASVVGTDAAGNVAFADIENLPQEASQPALGFLRTNMLFAAPSENIEAALSLGENKTAQPSFVRLAQGDFAYADFPAPALTQGSATLSFPAPAAQGAWLLRWQKADGTVLAEAPLRVTANADAPRLEATSPRDALSGDAPLPLTIKSLSSSGKPEPLIQGRVTLTWQKLDPAAFGWNAYRFGAQTDFSDTPKPVGDFLTDLQGAAQVHVTLPKPPQERGLYQAVLKVAADPDTGVAEAKPLVLPLRPLGTVIGIKALAQDARFTQNGIARFALIGLSSDGKPRDVSGLFWQIYEEGRSFAWYQDEGRWKYKLEPQLRPIGGGALTIKSDASSVLEWPVTAGNYRLEIMGADGKTLAQTSFSAGWDSSSAALTPALPPAASLPKTLQVGQEVTAHVTLPEPAMLTAIIADTQIRKIVHEFRPQGDNLITFTPAADWAHTISLSLNAAPQNAQQTGSEPLRAVLEASIAQEKPATAPTDSVSITASDDPSALILRKGDSGVLTFAIENNGKAPLPPLGGRGVGVRGAVEGYTLRVPPHPNPLPPGGGRGNLSGATVTSDETFHYTFTATAGLKIDSSAKGEITLGGKQSRAVSLSLSGTQTGAKELRLDVTDAHKTRVSRVWNIAVLPKANAMRSEEPVKIAPQQALLPATAKPRGVSDDAFVLVSRRPLNGLAEILSYVFNARPFTTSELALSIDALRLWKPVLAQTGLAPDFLIDARRQEQVEQMLRHQNPDGGFAPWRGADSSMDDTAAALTALGPDDSALAKPAKELAIGWLKQRLANTWVDEKERAPRAAAYAALAAADAVDPASLHYFSDTSATAPLPPLAEAHIAAAFKHIHDPDAAAFWIKKMLDENGSAQTVPLLNALAATDALPQGAVQAAMTQMAESLRRGQAPDLEDAAALLRAVSVDSANAGKGKRTNGKEIRDVSGVQVLRASDALASRNADAQPLFVSRITPVKEKALMPLPQGASITRHIYRLNGVELAAPAKAARGEIYMIELKGTLPPVAKGERILVQDGGSGMRPLDCPLPPKLDTLSFIPWFTPRGLSPITACELSPREMSAVLAPSENDSPAFTLVTFARIDAASITDLPPPEARVLKAGDLQIPKGDSK
ncbi:MAG: hypothetical protein P4M13_02980 [Alphaproteobacteria bacterium]|nr:hypothetical protein [Alphaproteobacteria bacterium]